MIDERIKGVELQQKRMLTLLITERKITLSQAQSLPISESME